MFAFDHEPAFMDGAHKDAIDANPAQRDAFWESLVKAEARAKLGIEQPKRRNVETESSKTYVDRGEDIRPSPRSIRK